MTKEEAKSLVLESKIIELQPIVRTGGFYKKGHDGEFMYTGCMNKYTLPISKSMNSFSQIFEENEQEAFEKLLNKAEGALNLFTRKSPFWGSFIIEIDKSGTKLDLSNPIHALQFKVIKANVDFFAPSLAQKKDKRSYKYAIVDGKVSHEQENKLAIKTEKAMDLFHDIKKSKTKMLNVLRILDRKPPKDSSIEWLKAEIIKIINQKEKTSGILNIDDFISSASDPQASSKIFVLDAIDAKAISASGGNFRVVETNQLIGKSMQTAVDWMDDAKNQEDRLLIESKINRSNR